MVALLPLSAPRNPPAANTPEAMLSRYPALAEDSLDRTVDISELRATAAVTLERRVVRLASTVVLKGAYPIA
jgi:hypothetical protein